MQIGKRIGNEKKKHSLTNRELGDGIISKSHLSNVLCGRFNLAEDILMALANRLEIPRITF